MRTRLNIRKLFFSKPDLPFDKEEANRYLPWVIGVMTALTSFILAFGVSIGNMVYDRQEDLSYRAQIHLPYHNGQEQLEAKNLLADLRKDANIAQAEILPAEELNKLLAPWIGTSTDSKLLPLPVALDLRFVAKSVEQGKINAEILRAKYSATYPRMLVDDYAKWLNSFNNITSTAAWMLYGLAALLLAAAITVILLITRASVQLHFSIVRLLHRIGAEDRYISRQFQINATSLALKGATPGALIAAGGFLLVRFGIHHQNIPSMPDLNFTLPIFALFLGIPTFMGVCVAITIQISVQGLLKKLH